MAERQNLDVDASTEREKGGEIPGVNLGDQWQHEAVQALDTWYLVLDTSYLHIPDLPVHRRTCRASKWQITGGGGHQVTPYRKTPQDEARLDLTSTSPSLVQRATATALTGSSRPPEIERRDAAPALVCCPPRLISHPPLARPHANRRLSSPRLRSRLVFSQVDEPGCICGHDKGKTRNSPACAYWTGRTSFVMENWHAVRKGSARVGGVLQQPAASCQPPTGDAHALLGHSASTLSRPEIPGCCGTVMHLQGGHQRHSLPANGAVSLAPVPRLRRASHGLRDTDCMGSTGGGDN